MFKYFLRYYLIILLTSIKVGFPFSGGGKSLEYLTLLTASARSAGLGNAYTGNNGDASCLYWNPAGLSKIYFTELNIISIPLFAGTQYTGINFAFNINKKNSLGLGLYKLVSGYAEKTDSIGRDLGYTFNDIESAYIIAYSKLLTDKIFIGLNFKYMDQNIDTYFIQGYAMDVGLIYKKNRKLNYGFCIQNILHTQFGTDKIGTNIKLGTVNELIKNKLNIFIDFGLIDIYNLIIFYSGGIEYNPFQNINLRIGGNPRELTFGLGLNSRKINFDYALSTHPLNLIHKFSINLKYDFIASEEEILIKEKYIELEKKKSEIEEEIKIERDKLKREYEQNALESWINSQLIISKTYIETKKYDEAEKILKNILQKQPDNKETYTLLQELYTITQSESIEKSYAYAQEYYAKKEYIRVLEETKRILSLKPEHKGALILQYLAQAYIYIADKKYIEAKGELIELLKIDPNNQEATILIKRIQNIIE